MPDMAPYPGAPRWVKVLGAIGLALLLVVVVLHLTGNGFRGHGAHVAPPEKPLAPAP